MYTLYHHSINGEETLKFNTEEEIEAKLKEIENSYTRCEYSRYYNKNNKLESILITTNPLLLTMICDEFTL